MAADWSLFREAIPFALKSALSMTRAMTEQVGGDTLEAQQQRRRKFTVRRPGGRQGAAGGKTPPSLGGGVRLITARATDPAGNLGPASTALSVTVESALPATPSALRPRLAEAPRGDRP